MKVVVLHFAALVLVYGDHKITKVQYGYCARGFLKLDGSCFHINTQPRNWPEALEYCQSIRANLVTMENESQKRLLESFMTFQYRSPWYKMPVSHTEGNFWIGGFYRRSPDGTDDAWLWISKVVDRYGRREQSNSQQAIQYSPEKEKLNIVQEQPGDPPKDCLMIQNDLIWSNYYCFGKLGTVCESVPFTT